MFEIDNTYTKNEIFEILAVPLSSQKGAWDTGYREYNNEIYIFANVGVPGRTGSDYNNFWDGELFSWEAKNNSDIKQPLIKKMISGKPENIIHLFTRTDNSLPFTYEGTVMAKKYVDSVPVKITWMASTNSRYEVNNNELYEGAKGQITINKYERNPLARRLCIKHYGASCLICSFDFEEVFGTLGKGFIHVHHIVALHEIGEEYKVDPIKDLIPICPNCHAMIHSKIPALSVATIKTILHENKHK